MMDYLKYYNLEQYLYEDVHRRFHTEESIGAFDLFSIIVWKANRAKTKMRRKLLDKDRQGDKDLEAIARNLTRTLYYAPNSEERLRLLFQDWEFRLPMATAILSVLWPDDFTIYDRRVCEQLGQFQELYNKSNFEKVWQGYIEFTAAVIKAAPNNLSLRNQDRYLWGKSAAEQLKAEIEQSFYVKSE